MIRARTPGALKSHLSGQCSTSRVITAMLWASVLVGCDPVRRWWADWNRQLPHCDNPVHIWDPEAQRCTSWSEWCHRQGVEYEGGSSCSLTPMCTPKRAQLGVCPMTEAFCRELEPEGQLRDGVCLSQAQLCEQQNQAGYWEDGTCKLRDARYYCNLVLSRQDVEHAGLLEAVITLALSGTPAPVQLSVANCARAHVWLQTHTSLLVTRAVPRRIGNLAALSAYPHLRKLAVPNHDITSLEPLASHHNLAFLDLSDNRIGDLSPLSTKTQLHTLKVRGNPVRVWPQWRSMTALRIVNVSSTPFGSDHLHALLSHPEVNVIEANATEIDDLRAAAQAQQLIELQVNETPLARSPEPARCPTGANVTALVRQTCLNLNR